MHKIFSCARTEEYIENDAIEINLIHDQEKYERVPAHEFILSVESDIIKALLSGSMATKQDKNFRRFTSTVFKEFLQFFYRPAIKISPENMIEVIKLAHEFNLRDV